MMSSDESVIGSTPPASPAEMWDAALREHGGHLLQSWQWGDFKSRFGWQPERVSVATPDGDGYAQVLFREKGPISIGYIPRGPVITGEANKVWPALRNEIDRAARRHRAIAVYIEPDAQLELSDTFREAGVVSGPAHLQPNRTVKVPLPDDETLLKQMHQKTRYNVRLAIRRGVQVDVKASNDAEALREFYGLMEDTSTRNEFSIHSYDYYEDFLRTFGDDAFFVFGSWEGKLAAVVVAAAFGDEAVYMYGASSTQNRGHGAAFLLQFEAMKWARERGCTTYDLWGIPQAHPAAVPAEASTPITGSKGEDMRGLLRFKTGFGGDIVTYPGTLERRYVPVLPWLARRMGVIQE